MHGKNSKENQNKQVAYYNEYVNRQKRVGVNLRHKSIAKKIASFGVSKNAHILEIGCGIGTFSGLLPTINPQGKSLCIDISDESIKEAAQTYKNEKTLTFECANAIDYDFGSQTFDVIVLPDVIEHIPLEFHSVLFEKLDVLLSPQGFIFIHIPNPYYLEWCHEHQPDLLQIIDQPIYLAELMQNISKTNLHICELKTYSIWVSDGDYQYIILRKNGFENFTNTIEEKITLWDKLKYKLDARKR